MGAPCPDRKLPLDTLHHARRTPQKEGEDPLVCGVNNTLSIDMVEYFDATARLKGFAFSELAWPIPHARRRGLESFAGHYREGFS